MTVSRTRTPMTVALAVFSAAVFFLLSASAASAALDCPKQNDPVSPSIVCTGDNYWCGGTCQAQPVCPGGAGDPYNVKTERNCTTCVCACPADKPNDCTASNQQCQATNPACALAHRASVCSTTLGVTTQVCGACVSGYADCGGVCEPTSDPSCPLPGYWDPCLKKCVEKYILSNPTVAQSPQLINAKVQGDMSMTDGNLIIASAADGKGDLYLSSTKAVRVDGGGQTALNVGNWYAGLPAPAGVRLNLYGELCLSNGTVCRSIWPTGLPDGTVAGQTVRYDGAAWVASSQLANDGTNIGIGTTAPEKNLDIRATAGGVIARLNDDIGGGSRLWTGLSLARAASEKWFVGMNITDDKLRFRLNGVSEPLIIDTTGNVGVGTASPAAKLHISYDVNNPAGIVISNQNIGVSSRVQLAFDTEAADWSIGADPLNSHQLTIGQSTNLTSARLVIGTSGNVGIGTNNPAKNLDVAGTAGGVIVRADDRSAGGLWTGSSFARAGDEKWFVGMEAAADKLLFRFDESSNPMVIDTTGNVGIGSASPAQKLDVDGTVQMTGFKLPTGALLNYILTSDAAGVGTWQKRPIGLPEVATAGDTVRYDGAAWVNNDLLFNDGSRVGVGETAPGYRLDVGGTATDLPIVRLHDPAGVSVWTGLQLDRNKGDQKWFVGMNDADDNLRVRRASSSDDVVIDTSGNLGIGTAPGQKLDVAGTAQMNGFMLPTGAVNNYVLTSDAAGAGTWRSILFADACTGGKFDHLTAGTYDGNQTSYANVNSYCGSEQHICTPDEILRSVYCTSSMPLPDSGNAWVANGPPGFTSPASNDCAGWTSNAATSYGAFWQFTGAGGGKAFATSCSLSLKFACCKQ